MNSDLLIKQFTINILVYLVTFKILNIKITSYRQWVKITSASVLTTITYAILKKYMAIPFLIIVSFILQNIFLSFFIKENISIFITNLVANAITYIIYTLATIIEILPLTILNINNNFCNFILITLISIILFYIFSKIKRIKNGENYIIRFKSPGREDRKIKHHDVIKGNVDFPENDQDIVIIKADGLPTYHFAHAVDDHLMHTTHVIRSDEWLSSVPLHLQLFQELGFKAPKYAHISPIMKNDNGNKRKLSKRKDPEAAVSYYEELGIPSLAVKEYLLNIANSTFENWRRQNKDASIEEFDFKLNKMSVSGALFDMVKLQDVSKIVISKMTAEEVYEKSLDWANRHDEELAKMLENKEYSLKVLGIERGNTKPRKDIAKWSDVKENIIYMYDDKFLNKEQSYPYQVINDQNDINKILDLYIEKYYNPEDDKQTWFNKIKEIAGEMGYAEEVKEFKANPGMYKAHVGDVSTVLRIALTGRTNTPDMYEIMAVLGKTSMQKRFEKAKK